MLPFQDARKLVIQKTTPHLLTHPRQVARKKLADALGDALAQEVRSDRDYPRSTVPPAMATPSALPTQALAQLCGASAKSKPATRLPNRSPLPHVFRS